MYKSKGSQSYTHLHQNLLNKLNAFDNYNQAAQYDLNYLEQQAEREPTSKYNKITELIQKAKGVTATTTNQAKITQAKAKIKKSYRNSSTAFLTGVNIVQADRIIESRQKPTYEFDDINDKDKEEQTSMDYLQQLNQIKVDDLAELRKMIKETDSRLNNYGRNLSKTKSNVMNAAERWGKSVDPMISYKIEKSSEYLPKLERKTSLRKIPSGRKEK